jgi:hypothetical protein
MTTVHTGMRGGGVGAAAAKTSRFFLFTANIHTAPRTNYGASLKTTSLQFQRQA